MNTLKLIAVGINFPIVESLANQFAQKCSHKELGFKVGGWQAINDEVIFDFDGVVKAKAGSFPCPITDGPYRAVLSAETEMQKSYNDGFAAGENAAAIFKAISELEKAVINQGFPPINEMIRTIKAGIKKTEIGLIPEKIWQEQRVKSINEAIERYTKENQIIPIEWIHERNKLLEKIHGNKAASQ